MGWLIKQSNRLIVLFVTFSDKASFLSWSRMLLLHFHLFNNAPHIVMATMFFLLFRLSTRMFLNKILSLDITSLLRKLV